MFRFYGRRETSFVCAWGTNARDFQNIKRQGVASVLQPTLPVCLEENEFVLLLEGNEKGHPTGEELTLFVRAVYESGDGDLVVMDVVTGSPDAFWTKQLERGQIQ